MSEAVLFSFDIHESAPATRLVPEQALEHLKSGGLTWMHMNADHADAVNWLERIDFPDHLIIDALTAENTRPRLEIFEGGALVILRGVNLNPDADPEDMVSLRLWIEDKRVISVQRRSLKAVRDLAAKCEQTPFIKNSGDILVQLITRLFIHMEPFVTELSTRVDNIEEELSDHPENAQRATVIDLRKKAILFRRYFAPQRDVMLALKALDVPWLNSKNVRQIQENQDRITRYVEDLDAIRERSQIIKDELANALSEKLNRNLYILSIVTAVFLPISFLTGLLGINVGGLPGVENEHAFYIVCGVCFILSILQLLALRLFRWL
jgi:zinc transporter